MGDSSAERLENYAKVIVSVGANVQPGQDVYLRADVAQLDVARAVAEQAYAAGADRVIVEYSDAHVRLSALKHAPIEGLSKASPWEFAKAESLVPSNAALISLTGNPEPHLFDGIDAERLAARPLELAHTLRRALLGGGLAWTIAAAPNPGWAQQIFGEPDVERLWDAVGIAFRLDEPDVVQAWRDHAAKLAARAAAVSALKLDAVRYHGEGTDLTVGLIPDAIWTGGGLTSSAGIMTMPNLPTEEVFTSPDRTRADGTMRLTRPLVMSSGAFVDGLEVRFEGGRIVEAVAEQGGMAVMAELETDEGARSLGEVALVDEDSRVRAAGVIFHDTLYDENAGSHVAWGQSFPFTISGGTQIDPQELFSRGLNTSAVHTDVVVGGPGVSVEGITLSGSVVPLISNNEWVLAL